MAAKIQNDIQVHNHVTYAQVCMASHGSNEMTKPFKVERAERNKD